MRLVLASQISLSSLLILYGLIGFGKVKALRPSWLLGRNEHNSLYQKREMNFSNEVKSVLSNNNLLKQDLCGSNRYSAEHGYLLKSYKLITSDKYELTIHRLIHPEDIERGSPELKMKKPIILVHGLLGSSASFLRLPKSVDYVAPGETINIHEYFDKLLRAERNPTMQANYQSVANQFSPQSEPSKSSPNNSFARRLTKSAWSPDEANMKLVDFDYDGNNEFGPFYRRQYRKTRMPKNSPKYITNSLAMTLSNFGYDVWLLNLRGSGYSTHFNGPYSYRRDAEYWDFDIDRLIREDLLASINFVKRKTEYEKPLGLVSYSYTSALVLRLLTEYPSYRRLLEPIVMIAPGPLSSSYDRAVYRKLMVKSMKSLIGHSGAFPSLGRKGDDLIVRAICSLPFASNLCTLFEQLLYGQIKSVSNLVLNESETIEVQRDARCNQTSTKVLRQLLDHMTNDNINPKMSPSIDMMKSNQVHRTIMIVHSRHDSVSRPQDVRNLRQGPLKTMALVDYQIESDNFGHSSFLFSERNQFLVNGEIVRMVALFDLLTHPPPNRNSKASKIDPIQPIGNMEKMPRMPAIPNITAI